MDHHYRQSNACGFRVWRYGAISRMDDRPRDHGPLSMQYGMDVPMDPPNARMSPSVTISYVSYVSYMLLGLPRGLPNGLWWLSLVMDLV